MSTIGVIIRYQLRSSNLRETLFRMGFAISPALIVFFQYRRAISQAVQAGDPGLTALIVADFPQSALTTVGICSVLLQLFIGRAMIDSDKAFGTLAQIVTRITRLDYYAGAWAATVVFGAAAFAVNLLIIILTSRCVFHTDLSANFFWQIKQCTIMLVEASTVGVAFGQYKKYLAYIYLVAMVVMTTTISLGDAAILLSSKLLFFIGVIVLPASLPTNLVPLSEMPSSVLWLVLLENIGYTGAVLLVGLLLFERSEINPKR